MFLVRAVLKDDPTVPDRLAALRKVQLTTVAQMAADGSMKLGGGLWDKTGSQCGNMAIVRFDAWEDVEAWVESHPFNQNGLWHSVEITELKCPPVFDTPSGVTGT